MAPARLITIEGLDGAGKTTLAAGLARALAERGVEVVLLREPGSVRTAERVRELVMDHELTIAPRAEALLYAAARAQLVEEAIVPRLRAGGWVVLDRFVDSSLAYQGAGRRLGIDAVREINEFATVGVRPDRTLWLALDAPAGRLRSSRRGQPVDRLEGEQAEFFERITDAYALLWRQEPQRIYRIDATRTREQVLADSLQALSDLL